LPTFPSPGIQDPNHGLLISDNGNINQAPCAIPDLIPIDNSGRQQHKVQLPGSNVRVPALDAMDQWIRRAVRSPNRPLTTFELTFGGGNPTGGVNANDLEAGRRLFQQANCLACHAGGKWTRSTLDFVPPPNAAEVASEAGAANANQGQFLFRFLKNIGSFNLNVAGAGNAIPGQPQIGAVEKDTNNLDGLGKDHNGDGKGNGFTIPSLLGIHAHPPYYHNGACETLDCVVADVEHRRAGLQQGQQDPLNSAQNRTKLVRYLESIDDKLPPPA
jgi:cytochrome c551/c552